MARLKKHILVVDDVTTNLRYIGEILKEKYSLSMAKSGTQALKMMEKNVPKLILLDIKMPEMDGYELLEKIKADIRYSDIPVIFLTADSEDGIESKCLRMGASDFIKKPFEPEVMLTRIERILAQEDRNEEIRRMAFMDSLTGLWNRKFIEEKITEYSYTKTKGMFMLLDLDNFKGINDTYGHVAGDEALKAFGRTLSSFVHKDDVVARIGGDEFAVFLKDATSDKLPEERMNGLIKDVEDELKIVKIDESISSVSIGIAEMPKDGNSFGELYNNADKAMYYVKRNGKNGFHFYDGTEKLEIADAENEDRTVIDLSQLRNYIDEKEDASGPYSVEYDSFKNIYQFLKRYVARTKSNVQVLLFTLKDLNLANRNKSFDGSMKLLEEAIRQSLRKNDVSSKYTESQFLVILMDVNEINRKIVLERIIKAWEKKNSDQNVILKYDIEEILGGGETAQTEGENE